MNDDEDRLRNDHWVSRGYQRNFSDLQLQVAIIDVASKAILTTKQPIRTNFRAPGFTTYIDEDGLNKKLEEHFARIERPMLNQIRDVSETNCTPQLTAAVVKLFAIHAVRNPAFKTFHASINARSAQRIIDNVLANPTLPLRAAREIGRVPSSGELRDVATKSYAELVTQPDHPATTARRQLDGIIEKLSRYHLQVVTIPTGLPGFVIGDVPVVHANLRTLKYGFRDELAIGDANLIIGPLTRRTAALFTAKQLPHVTLDTKYQVESINAIFIRSAIAQVACHPEDANATRRTARRLNARPIDQMLGL